MTIQNITVIGSGLMGRGIAHVSALGGFRTTMIDISDEIVEKALRNIREEMEKGVSLGKLSAELKDQSLARLTVGTDLEEAAKSADLIIEAVPEEMTMKIETFGRVDRVAPAHTILASNTSSLSITEMAGATNRAPHFLGMDFFNPVNKM